MCKPALFSCLWPFKMQKESKREDKRRKVTGKQLSKRSKKSGNIPRDRSNPKNKRSYERLSDEERRRMRANNLQNSRTSAWAPGKGKGRSVYLSRLFLMGALPSGFLEQVGHDHLQSPAIRPGEQVGSVC